MILNTTLPTIWMISLNGAEETPPPPPPIHFKLLSGDDFLLLNGENFDLLS